MQTAETNVPNAAARRPKPRRRSLERFIKRAFLLFLGLGLVGLLVVALLPRPVAVDVARAQLAPMRVTVDEDGATRVKDRYVVSAPLTGSLARIELDPGDTIKQGDVLARLVPVEPALLDDRSRSTAEARVSASLASQRQARALLERAKAHEEFTKKSGERQHALFESGSLTREMLDQAELAERTASTDVESAKFGVQVADYEVKMAQAALGRLKKGKSDQEDQLLVPSPVGGQVLKVLHKSEGVVQAGTPLVEVGDPKALEIVVDVLTSDAVNVKPGAEASVIEWGGPSLGAHVRTIEPSAFTRLSALGVEEQRVNVVLDLDGKRADWRALGDGYRVKAQIVTHQTKSALQAPSSAVFRHDTGWGVFRVEGDVARLIPVEIGLRTPRSVEISSGVADGERLVLHPSDRIRDGVAVEVR
jgi:HlyD family secretion protein